MWTIGAVNFTVIDLKEETEQVLPELQPLAGGTVYQYFGYINDKLPLQALVVGTSDKDAIKSMSASGIAYPLYQDTNLLGNFYIKSATFQWMSSYRQTFRADKDPLDLVFKCALDLAEE